jgi:predicted small metal-binding protein
MYCAHEVKAESVEEVLEQAIAHVKAEHGFTDDSLLPEMLILWRSRIREA